MIDPDALDQQLTSLFAAPGLTLHPRVDATAVIVTRARRRRHRRSAGQVAGSIVATCLLSVGMLQARSLGQFAPPAITGTLLPGELVMSGASVGSLRLGMTQAQAEATGLLITPAAGSGCVHYSGKKGITTVRIGSAGVSSIQVYSFIRTAQGAGIRDRYAKLQATYPSALPENPAGRTYRVPAPGQAHAWYVFRLEVVTDGDQPLPPNRQTRVAELSLQGPDC